MAPPWSITAAGPATVVAGESAAVTVTVRALDPDPAGRRGSVRITAEPAGAGSWLTVTNPTRQFGPGATEVFAVSFAVPAEATPGSYRLTALVLDPDDPAAETTAIAEPIAVTVEPRVPWALTADPPGLLVRPGQPAEARLRITGPPGRTVTLSVIPEPGPAVPGWLRLDRPTRVLRWSSVGRPAGRDASRGAGRGGPR